MESPTVFIPFVQRELDLLIDALEQREGDAQLADRLAQDAAGMFEADLPQIWVGFSSAEIQRAILALPLPPHESDAVRRMHSMLAERLEGALAIERLTHGG